MPLRRRHGTAVGVIGSKPTLGAVSADSTAINFDDGMRLLSCQCRRIDSARY